MELAHFVKLFREKNKVDENIANKGTSKQGSLKISIPKQGKNRFKKRSPKKNDAKGNENGAFN